MSGSTLLLVVFGSWFAAGVVLILRRARRRDWSVGAILKRAGAVVGMVALGPESWLLGKSVLAAEDDRSDAA